MIARLFDKINLKIATLKRMGKDTVNQNREPMKRKSADSRITQIAAKLRKIRERKNLTREQFCEPLKENSEYWGLIERGAHPFSLDNKVRPAAFRCLRHPGHPPLHI